MAWTILKRLLNVGERPRETVGPVAMGKQVGVGLGDPKHPARQQIDAASRFADNVAEVQEFGNEWWFSTNSHDGMHLVAMVDC